MECGSNQVKLKTDLLICLFYPISSIINNKDTKCNISISILKLFLSYIYIRGYGQHVSFCTGLFTWCIMQIGFMRGKMEKRAKKDDFVKMEGNLTWFSSWMSTIRVEAAQNKWPWHAFTFDNNTLYLHCLSMIRLWIQTCLTDIHYIDLITPICHRNDHVTGGFIFRTRHYNDDWKDTGWP